VSQSQTNPVPQKTRAVTIAGTLFLVLAAASALAVVVFAIEVAFPQGTLYVRSINSGDAAVSLVAAAVLGYTGLAMMLRWRRWRIWTGIVSWGLISMIVFSQFASPSTYPSDERMAGLILLAVVVFALIAKRLEPRRPDIAAVFDN